MGLIWVALAGIAVWALVRLGRQTEKPRRGHWRVTATLLGAVMVAGAVLAASHGAWLAAAGLAGAGLYVIWSSRMRPVVRSEPISESSPKPLNVRQKRGWSSALETPAARPSRSMPRRVRWPGPSSPDLRMRPDRPGETIFEC